MGWRLELSSFSGILRGMQGGLLSVVAFAISSADKVSSCGGSDRDGETDTP